MSSLRNAVKRVTHKERAQPRARAHLGLLEKKKDYRVRSRVFHDKEDRMNAMKQKADMRNPDEFYFGMHNSETKGGRHRKTMEAKAKELEDQIGPNAVKIMKNQDISYLRLLEQRDRQRIKKMQSSLQFIGDNDGTKSNRKHTVFVQSRKEAENFDVAEHFDTLPELAGRSFNRPRKDTILNDNKSEIDSDDSDDEGREQSNKVDSKPTQKQLKLQMKIARKIAKARAAAYGEMEARNKRLSDLEKAEAHLLTEKIVASKGRKRKVKEAMDGNPAIYKFRKMRAK